AFHFSHLPGLTAEDTPDTQKHESTQPHFKIDRSRGGTMQKLRIVALASGVTLAAGIAVAIAGTPFGGDDMGTIPSDAPKGPVTKCESKVAKAAGKLVSAIIKCHGSRATGKFTDDTGEDACESTALAKFQATKTTGCAACTSLAVLAAGIEQAVDSN